MVQGVKDPRGEERPMESSDLYVYTVAYAHTQTNEQNYKKYVSLEPQNSRKAKQASKQTKNQVAIPYLLEHLQPRVLKTPSPAKDEGGSWRKSYSLQLGCRLTALWADGVAASFKT